MAHGRLAFSWPACTGCLPLSESIEISSLHQLAGLKRPRISRRCFPPGLAFSHSVALNDRSENLMSKATIDGLHTAARLLKTWSNAPAAPTAARCVCTGWATAHIWEPTTTSTKAPCIDLTVTAQWRTLVGRATDMTLAPGSAMRRRSPRACSLLESGGWLLATSVG